MAGKMLQTIKEKWWTMPAGLALFSLLIATIVTVTSEPQTNPVNEGPPADIATLIPAGFSLVNIFVQSPEALDSMIGQFGVVDLYLGAKTEPFATGVRVLRMPGDPMQFGVLVPEAETPRFVAVNHEPFRITLQSLSRPTTFAPTEKPKRKIIWEE